MTALVVLGSMGAASAHAALVSSDPEDGATLATAPAEVSFEFNENIGNANLALVAPDGSSVAMADVQAVDDTVTGAPDDVDQAGIYTLSYRVVSADGHPIQGSVEYTVEAGQQVEQKAPPAAVADEQGFVHRHRSHIFWGVLAVAVAVGLLLMPIRGRDSAS